MLRRILIALVLTLALAVPATAGAWILPLQRVHPNGSGTTWTYKDDVAPLSGITWNILPVGLSYPWSQVTIAWNSVNGNVLVGCRGGGVETIRVWTRGHGWGFVRCVGVVPWQIVLRHITPAIHFNAIVTFR